MASPEAQSLADGQHDWNSGKPLDAERAKDDPSYGYGWCYSALIDTGYALKYWAEHWAAAAHLSGTMTGTRNTVERLKESGVIRDA